MVNIAANPRVALVVGWSDSVSVQVEGLADTLTGTERAAYGRIYTERFPGSRALREEFAIVRVIPCWLRYYDARPGSFRVAEGRLARSGGLTPRARRGFKFRFPRMAGGGVRPGATRTGESPLCLACARRPVG